MGKHGKTISIRCSAMNPVSTPLVIHPVDSGAIERFPRNPAIGEIESWIAPRPTPVFPAASLPLFRRLWADAFSGGCGFALVRSQQKAPPDDPGGAWEGGLPRFQGWIRAGAGSTEESEAHHPGHGAGVGFQTGVELGIVVLNGGGGVLQAVSGEHAHHGGPGRHLIAPLDQASH